MHGGMSALRRTDRPWAARIVRSGADGCVRPLPEGAPDRMDGRQVHDIEAHPGDGRQTGGCALEPALAAREELVPRAGARSFTTDPQLARLRSGQVDRARDLSEERGDVFVDARREAFVPRQ